MSIDFKLQLTKELLFKLPKTSIKNMIKQKILSISLCLILSFFYNYINACQCADISFTVDSDHSDLIFQGTLINKQDSISIGKVFYTFKVEKVWKGQFYKNVTIQTNYGGPACGVWFDNDKTYIVFSTGLATSRCRRNSEISICPDVGRLNYKYILAYRQEIAIDTFSTLSKTESTYFNTIVKSGIIIRGGSINNTDFTNRKIAFFEKGFISKNDFFERYGSKSVPIYFEKFSDTEIETNGGYYGIFCIQRKKELTKKKREKLFKRLRYHQ